MCLTMLGKVCGEGSCIHILTEHPLYILLTWYVIIPRITTREALHPCTFNAEDVIVPEPVITVILGRGGREKRPQFLLCF